MQEFFLFHPFHGDMDSFQGYNIQVTDKVYTVDFEIQ